MSAAKITKTAMVAMLIAFGVILGVLERLFLPPLTPWFRLGLANAATLLAVGLFDPFTAVGVALSRVLIVSMVGGTFLSPPFLLSLAGGVTSAVVMAAAWKIPGVGIWGISLLGAYTHISAQVAVLGLILPGVGLRFLWPALGGISLVTGTLVGWLAAVLLKRLGPVAVPNQI